MMKTVGVCVGEGDGRSAVCTVRWISECALADLPELACTDENVLEAMARADWIGIDAPFGWPHDIVSAIQTFGYFGRWPEFGVTERLRFRQTDWFVHDVIAAERDEDVWPLSAPGDRFPERALRCAQLLSDYAEHAGWTIDRIGVPPRLVPTARPACDPAAACLQTVGWWKSTRRPRWRCGASRTSATRRRHQPARHTTSGCRSSPAWSRHPARG